MLWDGYRWVSESATTARVEAKGPSIRDWIAVAVMVAGLVTLIIPLSSINAVGPVLRIDPSSGAVGSQILVVGSDFTTQSRIQLLFDGASTGMPVVKTGGQGKFSVRVTVPQSAAGSHMISAVTTRGHAKKAADGLVAGVVLASAAFTVAAPAPVISTPSPTPAAIAPSLGVAASPTASPIATVIPTTAPTASTVTTPPPATPVPSALATPAPVMSPSATPAPTATAAPPAVAGSKLTFGLGPAVDSARTARLVAEAPVRIMSTWYNGPNDLGWHTDAFHQSMYDQQYSSGRAVHLIVWTGDAEAQVTTPYGTACGRPYPLSARFPADMEQLAKAYAGNGRLYVTLFTEFQTFACSDNAWSPNAQTTAYWQALKARYLEALSTFHTHAPGSMVSLGWGGWQARWDDQGIGGGRSMFPYFADVMRASDFQSFQAMQSDSNVADIRAMVEALNDYGAVMLAHYKPNDGSQATFEADMRAIFTDAMMTELVTDGLFAMSFMDQRNINASEATYLLVKAGVTRYGN